MAALSAYTDAPTIRSLDALEHWWRPGALPRWVIATLALASATTFLLAHLGARHLVAYFDPGHHESGFWLREGLAIAVAAALAAAWLPRWRLSRAIRVAIVLPALQLAAIVAALAIWYARASQLPDAIVASPLVGALPLHVIVPVLAVVAFAIGRAIGGRRRGEWLHATAMLALVQLLLLGCWLPIAAKLWASRHGQPWFGWDDVRASLVSARLIAQVVVPPIVVATAFTALAIRRPAAARSNAGAGAAVLVVALVAATIVRVDPPLHASLVYANFVPMVFAFAVVAATALFALGALLWRRARSDARALARAPLAGTIADDEHAPATVAVMEIGGWLRGPRVIAREFQVRTATGTIAVPPGVEVLCVPPATSTHLGAGEALELLRPGDRVVVSGFAAAPADHPFRSSSALIPGSRDVWIARADDIPDGLATVALSLWRPCLAFVLVVVAVALPAIAGALANT